MRKVALILALALLSPSCLGIKEEPKTKPKKAEESKPELPKLPEKKSYKPGALYYYMLYLNYSSKGLYQKAYDSLKKAIETEPENKELLFEGAKLAAALKKYHEAKEYLSRILKKEPNEPKALKLLAGIEVVQGNLDRAKEIYEKLLKSHKDRDTFIFLADLLINEKDYQEALRVLKKQKKTSLTTTWLTTSWVRFTTSLRITKRQRSTWKRASRKTPTLKVLTFFWVSS